MRGIHKYQHSLTSLVIELLHNFTDNLTNRLDSFDVILSLCKILLQRLQRESHYIQLRVSPDADRDTRNSG